MTGPPGETVEVWRRWNGLMGCPVAFHSAADSADSDDKGSLRRSHTLRGELFEKRRNDVAV